MRVTDILGQFFPDENELIWLRSFDPKGLPGHLSRPPQLIETSRHQLANDRTLQMRLQAVNRTQGLYFVVNSGGNSDSSITRVNAVFCEMDDKPIIEQHDIFDYRSPWNPTIRIETKNSVHAYWLLSEPITVENFCELQQGLIAFYQSDRSIKNPSRVMRVPFFNHVSYADGYHYQRVNVHTCWPHHRYTLAELREAYPFTPPLKHVEQYRKPYHGTDTLESVKAELRSRIMALPSWTARGKWGCANGVCHDGKGDTGLRIDLASGAITCWSECSLEQILTAFGLEMPRKRDEPQWEYVPRRKQTSDLYHWYQERKRAKQEKNNV